VKWAQVTSSDPHTPPSNTTKAAEPPLPPLAELTIHLLTKHLPSSKATQEG
jgi:hypothetical protein